MPVLAHHAHGFLEVEIMGHPFPDGPTEHVLAFGFTGLAFVLMAYGAYALTRDLVRWRRRRVV